MSVWPSRARDGPSLDRGQSAPTLPPSGLQWRLATAADPLQPRLSNERVSQDSAHCSFWLNVCGLKFSFSPVSLLVLSDRLCFYTVCCVHFQFYRRRAKLLLVKTFPFLLFYSDRLFCKEFIGNKCVCHQISGSLLAAILWWRRIHSRSSDFWSTNIQA